MNFNKNLENELDLNFYISMNNDVAIKFNYDYNLIKEHFFKSGYQEKRLYSKLESNLFYFNDWIKYLNMNKDIVKSNINNEVLAFKHYLEHGINEKRTIYPKNIIKYQTINIQNDNKYEIIDIDFAKKMNKQLLNLNNDEITYYIDNNLKTEFLLYSLNHKNLYFNYDWDKYLYDYPDLKINKIFDKLSAIEHYICFGNKEGRIVEPKQYFKNRLYNFNKDNNQTENNQTENQENNQTENQENNQTENQENNQTENQENNQTENQENNQNENNCINFIDKIDDEYKNLLNEFKENILNNCNDLIYKKYLIENSNDNKKLYEYLCSDFNYKYYYLLNKENHELKNNESYCLKHFFEKGMKLFLPFSKQHYLLWINYDWNDYSIKHKLTNNTFLAFLDYIKNKFYYNKNVQLPNIKYPLNEFINDFYISIYDNNELELKNNTIFENYYNFLKDETNKLFPNIFNYFLSIIINWKSFSEINKLSNELKIYELIYLFKSSNYDFVKYNVEFNTIINLNIPDKNILIETDEFNEFFYKIIYYTKNNKSLFNLSQINKQFNKLFSKNLFDIPNNFSFINLQPYKSLNKIDLNFNFIIDYINTYDELYLLLISILYQNYNNYKIFILNKCDDPFLQNNITKIKETFNINNDIYCISNKDLNNNLKIFNKNKNNNIEKQNNKLFKSSFFKNKFKNYDINLLIDTNHYLKHNNILENLSELYKKDYFIFDKILIEKNNFDNKSKNILTIINTNLLLNNLFLLIDYNNFKFPEKDIKLIKDYCVYNNNNYIDASFYEIDFDLNHHFVNQLPIFILYENENEDKLKHINEISYFNTIQIKDTEEFNNFIEYVNSYTIYNYIFIVFIDKVENKFKNINFNHDLANITNYNLINIFNNNDTKKKNIKKGSKTVYKIFNYEAMILNYDFRNNYILSEKKNDKK